MEAPTVHQKITLAVAWVQTLRLGAACKLLVLPTGCCQHLLDPRSAALEGSL